jgi:hypothetical protein
MSGARLTLPDDHAPNKTKARQHEPGEWLRVGLGIDDIAERGQQSSLIGSRHSSMCRTDGSFCRCRRQKFPLCD